jgi:hypothetical protein
MHSLQGGDGIIFPWIDVESASRDENLQRQHPSGEGLAYYLEHAQACPTCGKSAAALQWTYFRSPALTWRALAGREGWLTVCTECRHQVDFFTTRMS